MDLNVRMGDMTLDSDADIQQNKRASAAPVGRSSLEVATNLRVGLSPCSASLPKCLKFSFKDAVEEYQYEGFHAL